MVRRIVSIITVIFIPMSMVASSVIHANSSFNAACAEDRYNCGELWEFYYWEKVPSLHINKIECDAENKLSVTIEVQPAELPGDPWEDQWEAEATVYLDGEKIGIFDIRKPTTPREHIDSFSLGTYTYILPWDITKPVMVKIVILAKGAVSSGGNTRYLFNETDKEEFVEPRYFTTTKIESNPNNRWLILLPVVSVALLILVLCVLLFKKVFTKQ
ncbi:MAG: hypothetical protein PHG45_03925 [Dehalococcoidales bacterium]|nr:hypothetical protein [Dehalococcoidales bacterium]